MPISAGWPFRCGSNTAPQRMLGHINGGSERGRLYDARAASAHRGHQPSRASCAGLTGDSPRRRRSTLSRTGIPLVGGYNPAMAAKKPLTRDLSVELAPHGIRVVGLRPQGVAGGTQ
jgi:NAD(P)-dependent dehydrogenase (short-subunit alcohol dehydrogenase family)